MPKNREEIINSPEVVSYLDLPEDMQREVPAHASEPDATTMVLGTLAKTGTTLYKFYQPALDKNAAKQLLTYVLQGNAEIAKMMYTANPRLLFMESSAEEWASGFVLETDDPIHRSVQMSPLRAMAATGDRWMLQDALEVLTNYTDEKTQQSGFSLAAEQIKQQLPNGFEYPPSTYDFTLLTAAIDQDQQLIQTGIPSPVTQALIEQFRKDFLPGVVKNGFLFNMNDLIKALEIYDQNFDPWNRNQLKLFWSQIVGYLERLVPAVIAQVISQGIANIVEGRPLQRTLTFHNYVTGKDITYFPLDDDPVCRLGVSFGVDSYSGWSSVPSFVGLACLARRVTYKTYVEQQQRAWTDLCNSCSNSQTIMQQVKNGQPV